VGLPFIPIEPPVLCGPGALPYSLRRGTRLVAVVAAARREETGNLLPLPSDHDILALLDQIK
jgi:hypothetical protein